MRFLCVSLRLRSTGASYWEQEGPREFCKCPCACVGLNAAVCTSNSSGALATGICMSRCQKLGRLGSRDSYWSDEVLSTGRVHTVCMYVCVMYVCMYVLLSVDLHTALPVNRPIGVVCVWVSVECVC